MKTGWCNELINSLTQKDASLLIIDGVAIFFIVYFHELGNFLNPTSSFLRYYFVIFGLTLFTFSSGFKLSYFHRNDMLQPDDFYPKYFIKRFHRTMKPYFGYSILTLLPLLLISYFAKEVLNLNYPGIDNFFSSLNLEGVLGFLLGNNFISPQLWYLYALLCITAFSFLILHIAGVRGLTVSLIPLIIFDFGFLEYLGGVGIIPSIMVYAPVFIWGVIVSYYRIQENRIIKNTLSVAFLVLLVVQLFFPNCALYAVPQIIFGFTFPFFIFSILNIICGLTYLKTILLLFGNFSFQIYLFHWPIILPFISRFVVNICNISLLGISLLITLLAMFTCILVYQITKKIKLNILFE